MSIKELQSKLTQQASELAKRWANGARFEIALKASINERKELLTASTHDRKELLIRIGFCN